MKVVLLVLGDFILGLSLLAFVLCSELQSVLVISLRSFQDKSTCVDHLDECVNGKERLSYKIAR